MDLKQFFSQNFPADRSLWETNLKAELKTPEVSGKVMKKTPEGNLPTLSLEASAYHQLRPLEAWKKAAQTYVKLPKNWRDTLTDDLAHGARVFFFEKDFLSGEEAKGLAGFFSSVQKKEEIVIFLLGEKDHEFSPSGVRLVDEKHLITGRPAWASGGTIVQELSQIALGLTDAALGKEAHLAVFLGSNFFQNIAKVRAARLLAQKILGERKISAKIFVTGLTSFRDWTLYERYSNLLRNDASVASGLIAGCDFVQSAGYQTLFDLETTETSAEHDERSRRMARNTSHILALESTLGLVEDASFGSFHLETLTEEYARGAWELMRKALPLNPEEVSRFYSEAAKPLAEERLKNLATRKHVLAGLNDFPDVKDELKLSSLPTPRFFRTGRVFEELRIEMEKISDKPGVFIAVLGDYGALNARINFVKNYFELLGLPVTDPGKTITASEIPSRKEKILVLVASDEAYGSLPEISTTATEKFVAGKIPVTGFENLFMGQDVAAVLQKLVSRWGKK